MGCRIKGIRKAYRLFFYMSKLIIKCNVRDFSTKVQYLRLRAPSAGGLGSIPGQGTRSHMPKLRVSMLQLKIQPASTKTLCNPIN